LILACINAGRTSLRFLLQDDQAHALGGKDAADGGLRNNS